jgi:hypothetical protein
MIWSAFFSLNTSGAFLSFKVFGWYPMIWGPFFSQNTRLSFSSNLCQARGCLALLSTPTQIQRGSYHVLCLWCQFKTLLQNEICSSVSSLPSIYPDLFLSENDEFSFNDLRLFLFSKYLALFPSKHPNLCHII